MHNKSIVQLFLNKQYAIFCWYSSTECNGDRRKSMKAYLVAERLVVDGVSNTVKTVHNLCKSMNFDKYSIQYHSTVQYLHHKKATLFNDTLD